MGVGRLAGPAEIPIPLKYHAGMADAPVVERFDNEPDLSADPALPEGWEALKASTPDERRKRRRRPCRLPGLLYKAEQVFKIQMRNISGDGAGFVCNIPLKKNDRIHLKTGLGATRRPRPAEVVYVKDRIDGRLDIGVRFVR